MKPIASVHLAQHAYAKANRDANPYGWGGWYDKTQPERLGQQFKRHGFACVDNAIGLDCEHLLFKDPEGQRDEHPSDENLGLGNSYWGDIRQTPIPFWAWQEVVAYAREHGIKVGCTIRPTLLIDGPQRAVQTWTGDPRPVLLSKMHFMHLQLGMRFGYFDCFVRPEGYSPLPYQLLVDLLGEFDDWLLMPEQTPTNPGKLNDERVWQYTEFATEQMARGRRVIAVRHDFDFDNKLATARLGKTLATGAVPLLPVDDDYAVGFSRKILKAAE